MEKSKVYFTKVINSSSLVELYDKVKKYAIVFAYFL